MLKELTELSDDKDIPLDFIHSNDLSKFIDYLKYHVNVDKSETRPSDQDIKSFDEKFVSEITSDNKMHLRFIVNTDKLQIHNLFKLVVKAFQEKLKDKDVDTVRKEWFVTKFTPLTPDQHHEIFETTDWLYPEVNEEEYSK
jgi:S-phase kinase-associated protein 1